MILKDFLKQVPLIIGIFYQSILASPNLTPGVWVNITPAGIDPKVNGCTDLRFDPGNPSTLFAIYGDLYDKNGMMKSTDGGSTWKSIGNLGVYVSLGRIRIDPRNSLHMYFVGSVRGNSNGFWVSNDGGNTWAMPAAFVAGAKTTWTTDIYNMEVDPTDFNHVIFTSHSPWLAYGSDAGVLETKDGGVSYLAHKTISGIGTSQGIAFLYDPAHGNSNTGAWLLGGGYGKGLYRTTDGGNNWSTVSASFQDNHGGFQAYISKMGNVYIGGDAGIVRSTDNGITWASANSAGSWHYAVIGDGNHMYTGKAYVAVSWDLPIEVANEGGVNEGKSWSNYSTQIITEGPFRMCFDPTNRIVYSANWGGGAWALKVIDPPSSNKEPLTKTVSAISKIGPTFIMSDGRIALRQMSSGSMKAIRFYDVKGRIQVKTR